MPAGESHTASLKAIRNYQIKDGTFDPLVKIKWRRPRDGSDAE